MEQTMQKFSTALWRFRERKKFMDFYLPSLAYNQGFFSLFFNSDMNVCKKCWNYWQKRILAIPEKHKVVFKQNLIFRKAVMLIMGKSLARHLERFSEMLNNLLRTLASRRCYFLNFRLASEPKRILFSSISGHLKWRNKLRFEKAGTFVCLKLSELELVGKNAIYYF